MNQYICPSCGSCIELENINVSADIAMCKLCGNTHKFSAICGLSEVYSVDLKNKPKGISVLDDVLSGRRIVQFKKLSPVLFFSDSIYLSLVRF